ncbi:hypothetical protein Tco_0954482 [Tanacetum coccineum]|uniref:Uncharacterized protein n=1 Tax=Tanacetum coccineum TaxID=301880 RepID=A0ABQ5E4I2_9ASTR
MATPDVFVGDHHALFDVTKGDAKARGYAVEKKIEYLESLNDRLHVPNYWTTMYLVPWIACYLDKIFGSSGR